MAEIPGLGFQTFFEMRPTSPKFGIVDPPFGIMRVATERAFLAHSYQLYVVMTPSQHFANIIGGLTTDFSALTDHIRYRITVALPLIITFFDHHVLDRRRFCRSAVNALPVQLRVHSPFLLSRKSSHRHRSSNKHRHDHPSRSLC